MGQTYRCNKRFEHEPSTKVYTDKNNDGGYNINTFNRDNAWNRKEVIFIDYIPEDAVFRKVPGLIQGRHPTETVRITEVSIVNGIWGAKKKKASRLKKGGAKKTHD